jgi:hypothetical protein
LFDFNKRGLVDGLKKSKYHILFSWILLVCFVAGQCMVYAHQHPFTGSAKKTANISRSAPRQVVKEKCYLCDVMHHNTMLASYQVYLNPVAVAGHAYKSVEYHFASIRLILSGDRAPPSHQS